VRQSKDYSFIQNRVPSPLNNNFLFSAEQPTDRRQTQIRDSSSLTHREESEEEEDYMSLPVAAKAAKVNLMT